MRDTHDVLDIGCGSLRLGRLLLVLLRPGKYCGLEPEAWAVEKGIENEVGQELIALKQPVFDHNSDFDLSGFDRKFDRVIAQSIINHADPGQIRTCFGNVAVVLRKSGVFIFNYHRGRYDSGAKGWSYPQNVKYRPDSIARWAAEVGLATAEVFCQGNWTIATHSEEVLQGYVMLFKFGPRWAPALPPSELKRLEKVL